MKTLKEYALAYARLGWRVFPAHDVSSGSCSCGSDRCNESNSAGKHPRFKGWQEAATNSPAMIEQWWSIWPHANIGLATGKGSGVWALDIDVKDGGDHSLEALTDHHGELPETPMQSTGGGGAHYLFRYDPRIGNRVSAIPGVDVRSDGGLIILGPSRNSNGLYEFDLAVSPLEGCIPAPAPEWLISQLQPVDPEIIDEGFEGADPSMYSLDELRAALAHIPSDNRDTWYKVGMALHSINGEDAFDLWCEWSSTSEKYDPRDQRRVWSSFGKKGRLVGPATIIWLAEQTGYVHTYDGGGVDISGLMAKFAIPNEQETQQIDIPKEANREDQPVSVQRGAGIIDVIARYADETSARPQPELSVHAALALCSVVLGRKFVTDQQNFTSMYFLSVAKSTSGKEHGKTVIDRILHESDMLNLMGGKGYTSEGAIFSTLMAKPRHITVIDELGRYLEAAKHQGNSHQQEVNTCLMEAVGRLHGVMIPQQYSKMMLTKDQRDQDDEQSRVIMNPGISIYSMTTPNTLYSALSDKSIKDGFLGRFLICESSVGRQLSRRIEDKPVPQEVIEWVQGVTARANSAGNLAGVDSYDSRPALTRIPFATESWMQLQEFEQEILDKQDQLEAAGLDAFLGRTKEMAMRVALIVSLAKNQYANVVDGESTAWAIKYVSKCYYKATDRLISDLGKGEFEEAQEAFLEAIKAKGQKGMTTSDLCKAYKTKKFKARERGEILQHLIDAELIRVTTVATGRKPKQVFHAI